MASYFGKSVGVGRGVKNIAVPTTKGYPGYANGGVVQANTFRSDAEKQVDQQYAPKAVPQPNGATKKLNDKIDAAEGGVRG